MADRGRDRENGQPARGTARVLHVKRTGRAPLGIRYTNSTITFVKEGGVGEACGFAVGMTVREIGDYAIQDAEDMKNAFALMEDSFQVLVDAAADEGGGPEGGAPPQPTATRRTQRARLGDVKSATPETTPSSSGSADAADAPGGGGGRAAWADPVTLRITRAAGEPLGLRYTGTQITLVKEGSVAARCGVEVGMVVREIGEYCIEYAEHMRDGFALMGEEFDMVVDPAPAPTTARETTSREGLLRRVKKHQQQQSHDVAVADADAVADGAQPYPNRRRSSAPPPPQPHPRAAGTDGSKSATKRSNLRPSSLAPVRAGSQHTDGGVDAGVDERPASSGGASRTHSSQEGSHGRTLEIVPVRSPSTSVLSVPSSAALLDASDLDRAIFSEGSVMSPTSPSHTKRSKPVYIPLFDGGLAVLPLLICLLWECTTGLEAALYHGFDRKYSTAAHIVRGCGICAYMLMLPSTYRLLNASKHVGARPEKRLVAGLYIAIPLFVFISLYSEVTTCGWNTLFLRPDDANSTTAWLARPAPGTVCSPPALFYVNAAHALAMLVVSIACGCMFYVAARADGVAQRRITEEMNATLDGRTPFGDDASSSDGDDGGEVDRGGGAGHPVVAPAVPRLPHTTSVRSPLRDLEYSEFTAFQDPMGAGGARAGSMMAVPEAAAPKSPVFVLPQEPAPAGDEGGVGQGDGVSPLMRPEAGAEAIAAPASPADESTACDASSASAATEPPQRAAPPAPAQPAPQPTVVQHTHQYVTPPPPPPPPHHGYPPPPPHQHHDPYLQHGGAGYGRAPPPPHYAHPQGGGGMYYPGVPPYAAQPQAPPPLPGMGFYGAGDVYADPRVPPAPVPMGMPGFGAVPAAAGRVVPMKDVIAAHVKAQEEAQKRGAPVRTTDEELWQLLETRLSENYMTFHDLREDSKLMEAMGFTKLETLRLGKMLRTRSRLPARLVTEDIPADPNCLRSQIPRGELQGLYALIARDYGILTQSGEQTVSDVLRTMEARNKLLAYHRAMQQYES